MGAGSVALSTHYMLRVPQYEEFNPKRIERKKPIVYRVLDATLINPVDYTLLKVFGNVTPAKYRAIRDKALEIAGVDEFNPADNVKRFSLYRQLGVAVRETEDAGKRIYIPIEVWVDFITKNGGFDTDKWKKLRDEYNNYSFKACPILLGKAFFNADSKSQGGNEDGRVDDSEWKNTLPQIGYMTIEDVVNDITARVRGGSFSKEDLKDLMRKITASPDDSVTCNTSELVIPPKGLEAYVSSQ